MSSTMSQPPQLLHEINEEYERVQTLWDRFTETQAISGLDTKVVQQARSHITTARDSLKNAREVMQKGSQQ